MVERNEQMSDESRRAMMSSLYDQIMPRPKPEPRVPPWVKGATMDDTIRNVTNYLFPDEPVVEPEGAPDERSAPSPAPDRLSTFAGPMRDVTHPNWPFNY